MMELPIDACRDLIRDVHGCDATHLETVHFAETHRGKVAWKGDVQVFELLDHSTAARCYVWSHQDRDTGAPTLRTALHRGRVTSPQAAVRAAIVERRRGRKRR